jgi:enoyl-CoA hydratase/carnithine racemase
MIDAATALDMGLVNRVVPNSSLPRVVDEAASAIGGKSRAALELGKRAVREQANMSLADAYDCASRAMIENMLAADAAQGIGAFLDKSQSGSRDA